jgi:hypothetical protein
MIVQVKICFLILMIILEFLENRATQILPLLKTGDLEFAYLSVC